MSLIPAPVAKALELTFAALDFLNRAWDGLRKMPRPKPLERSQPLSHLDVEHIRGQVRKAAVPPPRKR